MPGRRFYDILYRIGAPWGGGPRPELVSLVESGRVSAKTHPRALDLGCGEGEDTLFLAERGWEVVGVDFSAVALRHAAKKANRRGLADRVRFVEADLTADSIAGVTGPFDLIVDGGSLDDLQAESRVRASRWVHRLSRPGTVFLLWCFFARRADLPIISFVGPSRFGPGFEPGEVERLFGSAFSIERIDPSGHRGRWAAFVLERAR